jgi:dolichyl-phosphate beta-glucosyltransferase
METIDNTMTLSVVIPAYNEEDRLPKTLDRIIEFFDNNRTNIEIVVVNDGSNDGTRRIIQKYSRAYKGILLVDNTSNRGKGYSAKRGVQKATGNLILFSDADLSTPIEEYIKLKRYIDKGCDIAIGSRRIKGADIKKQQPLHRRLLGRGFGFLTEIYAVKGIKDTQCGFKLFRRDIAKSIFDRQKIDGFGYDVEVLFLASKLFNAKIKEVPVTWIDSADASKVNAAKETFRMFRDLIKVRLLD